LIKSKLVRITTVPESLAILLKGQLGFMQTYFNVTAISSEGLMLNEVQKTENINTFSVNMTRKITPIKDLIALFKLYKFLKLEKPEIVHTHTPKAGLLGMLASYFANVPNRIHTIAGLPVMESRGLKREILLLVEKITYGCATMVCPNSNGLKDFVLSEKLTSKNKLSIIGKGSSNGINTDYFNKSNFKEHELSALRTDLNINKSDFVFIFVGRIVTDKGINELVKVFCELSIVNKSVKLLLVGSLESDLDPLLPSVLKEIKTNKQIIYVGFKKDVRPYFAIANVLVFPSYREGFPNVVMQAGAMDLPAIVSNINGCNEIIKDQENGLIIPVKNTEKLKEAMQNVFSDRQQLELMKLNTRSNIVNQYDQNYIWQELLKTYQAL
jgi:glycosyltransferase involved in cell wall biosynthesis